MTRLVLAKKNPPIPGKNPLTTGMKIVAVVGAIAAASAVGLYLLLGRQTPPPSGPMPLSVSASASPMSGVAPLVVDFSATAVGGTPPYSYTWDFGDGTNSGAQSAQVAVHTYTGIGTFPVAVTAGDAAGASTYTIVRVSVASSSGQLLVSATPFRKVSNPGYDYFYVTIKGGTPGGTFSISAQFPPYPGSMSGSGTFAGTGDGVISFGNVNCTGPPPNPPDKGLAYVITVTDNTTGATGTTSGNISKCWPPGL